VDPRDLQRPARALLSLVALSSLGCERADPLSTTGPHHIISLQLGEQQSRAGWLKARAVGDAWLIERTLQLSAQRALINSRYALERIERSSRLTWSLSAGEQRSSGELSIRCQADSERCLVVMTGEGGVREEELKGSEALISELWPWQLAERGCPVQEPLQSRSFPLIRPLSAHSEADGISITCLPPSAAPSGLDALWGARYQSQSERGELWWTAEGLGRWDGAQGELSWRLEPARAELSSQPPVRDVQLEALAQVPIRSARPQLGAPPRSAEWRGLSWARLALKAHPTGASLELLETQRQLRDAAPSRVTRVRRGPRLSDRGALMRSAEGREPPAEALTHSPSYPTRAPAITRLVARVAPSSLGERARAERLLAWVRAHIKVEQRAGLPRVLETLSARAGDCNEQSALLTSLYRAAGLPAEQVFGLIALGDHAGYHAWVRVWLGGRWLELDPARGLDYVTAAHWAISAGDERAQEALRPLLMSARAELLSWGSDQR